MKKTGMLTQVALVRLVYGHFFNVLYELNESGFSSKDG